MKYRLWFLLNKDENLHNHGTLELFHAINLQGFMKRSEATSHNTKGATLPHHESKMPQVHVESHLNEKNSNQRIFFESNMYNRISELIFHM